MMSPSEMNPVGLPAAHTAHLAIDQLIHDLPNRHSALYDKGGLFHKQGDFSGLLGLVVLGGGIAPL